MNARYRVLSERIRRDLTEIDRTVDVVQRHWQHAVRTAEDQDAFLNSVALNLHSFYSGLERIFEAVAIEIDGGLPRGEDWHSEILRQMALDLTPTRPPLLRPGTTGQLDEYRKFRHLIRNIYATNLEIGRLQSLVLNLPGLWRSVRGEIGTFLEFLAVL